MNIDKDQIECFVFEGLEVYFSFKTHKPKFGDLFLIVGFENPNFPPETEVFKPLAKLGF